MEYFLTWILNSIHCFVHNILFEYWSNWMASVFISFLYNTIVHFKYVGFMKKNNKQWLLPIIIRLLIYTYEISFLYSNPK